MKPGDPVYVFGNFGPGIIIKETEMQRYVIFLFDSGRVDEFPTFMFRGFYNKK